LLVFEGSSVRPVCPEHGYQGVKTRAISGICIKWKPKAAGIGHIRAGTRRSPITGLSGR